MTIAQCITFIRLLTDTDSNGLTNANVLILLNDSMEKIAGKILVETSGGGWLFGDPALTALPTYTLTMTDSEPFYQIDSLTTPLIILGAEVLDNTGIWHPLNPITLQEIREKGIAQVEYYKTDGRPVEYEKREHAVVLYPAPDNGVSVTLASGLKIFFLRGMTALTDATSTTAISFPSPMHGFLAYDTALAFAISRGLANVNQLRAERDEREKKLMSFFARRNQDERPIMSMKPINHI